MINMNEVCDALILDIVNQLKLDLIDFVLIPITGYKQVPNYRLKLLCLPKEKTAVVNYLKEAYKLFKRIKWLLLSLTFILNKASFQI